MIILALYLYAGLTCALIAWDDREDDDLSWWHAIIALCWPAIIPLYAIDVALGYRRGGDRRGRG